MTELSQCDPGDLVSLTRALVDIPSVSKGEKQICDELLAWVSHIRSDAKLDRINNNLVVRIGDHEQAKPILFAGHIDTVPSAMYNSKSNEVSSIDGDILYGLGTSDMKSGIAIMMALISSIEISSTFIFYEAEEIVDIHNGLRFLAENHPELLQCSSAILLEPTNGQIEMGCQGTLTLEARFAGARAHSARPWMGDNAIHKIGPLIERIAKESKSQPKVDVEGLTYSPALEITKIHGGTSANVIPDECIVTINHRFAPSTSSEQALEYVKSLCSDADSINVVNLTTAAYPAMNHPLVSFASDRGCELVAKLGWTDVARFAELGIEAVNCGPGDSALAHRADEHIDISKLQETYDLLKDYIASIS